MKAQDRKPFEPDPTPLSEIIRRASMGSCKGDHDKLWKLWVQFNEQRKQCRAEGHPTKCTCPLLDPVSAAIRTELDRAPALPGLERDGVAQDVVR